MRISGAIAVAIALVACYTTLYAQSDTKQLRAIFEPADERAGMMALAEHILQKRAVTVRLDILDGLSPGDGLWLELFPQEAYTAYVERIEHRAARRYSCFGQLADAPLGYFLFVVEGDVMVGTISLPSQGRRIDIRYEGTGVHSICEIDEAALPPCGGTDPDVGSGPTIPPAVPSTPQAAGRVVADGKGAEGPCGPPPGVFDAMILYTPLARAAAGGVDAINAQCQVAIDLANLAYVKSDIYTTRARLVYRGEIAYDENGTYKQHLNRLMEPDDGIMDDAHALRNGYSADVVTLLVDDPTYCGRAFCIATEDTAFSVVTWGCITGHSYAHEVGHNQGCEHDRANADPDCALHSYSYGWRFLGEGGDQYRTVMAYPPGTRIEHFSNPDVDYDGVATGVPIGQPDEAHNAETIRLISDWVKNFRLTRFDIWVDFDYAGEEFGTYSFPYNTLAEGVIHILVGVGASELPSLWIQAGSTSETMTITKPMAIHACNGSVIIGAQP